jgi:hypothetical protein
MAADDVLELDENVEDVGDDEGDRVPEAYELDPNAELPTEVAESALETMLSSTPQDAPQEKFVVKRLKFTVTLQGISERAIDTVGRRSERAPTKSERARGIFANQRDASRFNLLLVAEGMVDPELTNPQLLAKYGPRPEDVVKTWFLPGEIVQMADTVMDLSGYGEEAVVRAKK